MQSDCNFVVYSSEVTFHHRITEAIKCIHTSSIVYHIGLRGEGYGGYNPGDSG